MVQKKASRDVDWFDDEEEHDESWRVKLLPPSLRIFIQSTLNLNKKVILQAKSICIIRFSC